MARCIFQDPAEWQAPARQETMTHYECVCYLWSVCICAFSIVFVSCPCHSSQLKMNLSDYGTQGRVVCVHICSVSFLWQRYWLLSTVYLTQMDKTGNSYQSTVYMRKSFIYLGCQSVTKSIDNLMQQRKERGHTLISSHRSLYGSLARQPMDSLLLCGSKTARCLNANLQIFLNCCHYQSMIYSSKYFESNTVIRCFLLVFCTQFPSTCFIFT